MVKRRGYKCPWCFQTLNSIQAFRFHTRTKHPHESRYEDTDPQPNKLLSNRSEIDSSSGVFEFDGILAADEFATCVEIAPDSDDDSYYSDFALEYELGGGGVYSSSSSVQQYMTVTERCTNTMRIHFTMAPNGMIGHTFVTASMEKMA